MKMHVATPKLPATCIYLQVSWRKLESCLRGQITTPHTGVNAPSLCIYIYASMQVSGKSPFSQRTPQGSTWQAVGGLGCLPWPVLAKFSRTCSSSTRGCERSKHAHTPSVCWCLLVHVGSMMLNTFSLTSKILRSPQRFFYMGQSSNGVVGWVDPSLLTQSVKVAPSIVPVIPAVSGSMWVRESGRGAWTSPPRTAADGSKNFWTPKWMVYISN